ncbi:MAG: TlpA family protein disulfide reductase [Bacteroidales bacterium]|nr:TlpA family protein disulfide reductase [Bacteroidales bacterium]
MQGSPGFTLTSLSGSQVKLSDYSNKVVVLFFFGNNCPSCKAAGPDVESNLFTPFKSRTDYQILGLDQWNGNSASVEAFKTTAGVTFPLLLNAASVAADYKTTYDRLVVIDKSGKTVFTGTQNAANDIAAVKQKVESLL